MLGLGNLVRKDLSEWLHGKRPWIVLGVTTSVFALAAANARITEWAARSFPAEPGDGPAKVLSVQPIDNLLFAIGTQFIVLAVIFATMSLLLAERDSGTLAWTISKPVSRTSVLVSKWLTSTLILWVAAVVIPLTLTTALVTVLYGLPDLAIVIALGVTADHGAGVLRGRRADCRDIRSEPGRRRRDRPSPSSWRRRSSVASSRP